MDGKKPPETDDPAGPRFRSMRTIGFGDSFSNSNSTSSIPALVCHRTRACSNIRLATIRAMFHTLLDSGMDTESFAETVGRVLIEKRPGSIEWNSELNQRRFELIDKEIQETLTPAERVELAGLTGIMREQLESEANLPMEGAKALHRKLLELAVKDKPS